MSTKYDRTVKILIFSLLWIQLFSNHVFAADQLGAAGIQYMQPSCSVGDCSSSQSQSGNQSQTSSQFLSGQSLLQASNQKTFRIRQGESIQSVINQSNSGDIIEIEAGTYSEELNLSAKSNLTLMGISTANGSLPVLNLRQLMLSEGTILKNLTFSKPSHQINLYTGSAGKVNIDNIRVDGYVTLSGTNNILLNSVIETGVLGQFAGTPSLTVYGGKNLISKNVIQSANEYVVRIYSGNTGGNTIDGNTLVGGGPDKTSYALIVNRSTVSSEADVVTNMITSQAKYDFFSSGAETHLSYSLLQSGSATGNFLKGNGVLFGMDPKFVNPDARDYRLFSDSPARDAGNLNSPLDADGTRADMGARGFTRDAVIPGYLVTLGEYRKNLDVFMIRLQQELGITWITRAEIEALKPVVANNEKFTVTDYLLTLTVDSLGNKKVAVFVDGVKETFQCTTNSNGVQSCLPTSVAPIAIGLYKPSPQSKGIPAIVVSGLNKNNIGFSKNGDLFVAPDYGSAMLIDNMGQRKAYISSSNIFLIQRTLSSPDGKSIITYAKNVSTGKVSLLLTNPYGKKLGEVVIGKDNVSVKSDNLAMTNEGVFYVGIGGSSPLLIGLKFSDIVNKISGKEISLPVVSGAVVVRIVLGANGTAKIIYSNGQSAMIDLKTVRL